jgi:hypothetical protein
LRASIPLQLIGTINLLINLFGRFSFLEILLNG